MDNDILKKIQNEELDILKEIKRVCDKNNIQYFLMGGTLLGAVRHKGFIPWDDDIDIGMLREEYEKFNAIAAKELKPDFFWQTWKSDSEYPLAFGKVRKRGTRFIEGKSNILKENGFFVDVFPYDYAMENEKLEKNLQKKQKRISRILLMKNQYKPWYDEGKTNFVKRLGYIPYQVLSLFCKRQNLIDTYENIVLEVPKGERMYQQTGSMGLRYVDKKYIKETKVLLFENEMFSVPIMTETLLEKTFGDYMKMPPVEERINRHQILEVQFTDMN